MNCYCALALVLLPVFTAAQVVGPRYGLPPIVPPPSCAFALGSVNTLQGPVAYRRLAIQLEALQSAQDGVAALNLGLAHSKKEDTPALAMSDLFTGTEKAHDALICSASLIAMSKPTNEDDGFARTQLIVAYNQEAAAIADLEAHAKEQFLRTGENPSQATVEKDAEQISMMTRLQEGAASTLARMTVFSLMLAVDTSDLKAKDTRQTVLPCDTYQHLRVQSTRLANQTKSAYTVPASLIARFLSSHRCNRGKVQENGLPHGGK